MTHISTSSNFWQYTVRYGYDLTHSPTAIEGSIRLDTTTSPITIDPSKTTLLIINMQNFFLSRALGRFRACHIAEEALLTSGIPAARKAGIQIIWLNWGLLDEDFDKLPPYVFRTFSFFTSLDGSPIALAVANDGPTMPETDEENIKLGLADHTIVSRGDYMLSRGLGLDLGKVALETGEDVDGGRLLMRSAWNTALHPPLSQSYVQSLDTSLPDKLFYKDRHSGMSTAQTECTDFLLANGIKTLMFSGVATDMCVQATLQDASHQGFDCIMLEDGCGTHMGYEAQITCKRNCEKTWGFVSSCEALATAVKKA